MKSNIVFSTIPVDFLPSSAEELRANWDQIFTLLRLADFPVSRIYLFVNPSNRGHIKKFYAELITAIPHVNVKFVRVTSEKDFSVSSFIGNYIFFQEWFTNFSFDTERFQYYFHFSRGNIFAHAFMLTMLINMRNIPCEFVHLRRNLRLSGPQWRAETYTAHMSKWIAELSNYERQHYNAETLLKEAIPANNPKFNTLIHDMEHVALHSSAPILLLGPTGSGKSQLAKRMYALRRRVGRVRGEFVAINCATLEPGSAHSTLFGHVRGAFTGAVGARQGLLKLADGGILFLDEVGELSLDMQARLLKALEEKAYLPLGADREVRSQFQLICATNGDLREAVRVGKFRQDLLARLNLWEFSLLALRDRVEDIAPNVDYELRRLRAEKGLFVDFTPEARQRYLGFAVSPEALWPSNFRSLTGSIERMVTYSLHGVIDVAIVEKELALLRAQWQPMVEAYQRGNRDKTCSGEGEGAAQERFPLQRKLTVLGLLPRVEERDIFDAVQLEEVLDICRRSPSRSEAGRRLYACSRVHKTSHDDTARLNKYLKSYGLQWESIARLAGDFV